MLILRIHRYYIINLVSQNSKLIMCSFKENSSLISDSSGIILSTKQHVWARHTVAYNHICLGCYSLKGTPDQKQITCNQINNSLKTTGIRMTDQDIANVNHTGGNYQSQRDCAQSPPARLTYSKC